MPPELAAAVQEKLARAAVSNFDAWTGLQSAVSLIESAVSGPGAYSGAINEHRAHDDDRAQLIAKAIITAIMSNQQPMIRTAAQLEALRAGLEAAIMPRDWEPGRLEPDDERRLLKELHVMLARRDASQAALLLSDTPAPASPREGNAVEHVLLLGHAETFANGVGEPKSKRGIVNATVAADGGPIRSIKMTLETFEDIERLGREGQLRLHLSEAGRRRASRYREKLEAAGLTPSLDTVDGIRVLTVKQELRVARAEGLAERTEELRRFLGGAIGQRIRGEA